MLLVVHVRGKKPVLRDCAILLLWGKYPIVGKNRAEPRVTTHWDSARAGGAHLPRPRRTAPGRRARAI